MLKHILGVVKERLLTFKESLIKEGKTTALIHAYLSFFKHLFADFKISNKDLNPEEFKEWRIYFHELLATLLDINRICANLLSNNRLTEEGDDMVADSRGHPMQSQEISTGDDTPQDYENLILVGIWLAVKENGETLCNLLSWADLPQNKEDDSNFLVDADVH